MLTNSKISKRVLLVAVGVLISVGVALVLIFWMMPSHLHAMTRNFVGDFDQTRLEHR